MSEQRIKSQQGTKGQEAHVASPRFVSPETSSTGEGPMTPDESEGDDHLDAMTAESFLRELENLGGLGVWRLLRDSTPIVRANRECVLAMVRENGLALDYAAKPL